jgi:uncharacterized MAPEG superfamily protein
MTVFLSCLLIAILLPFIAKVPVAFAMNKNGGYNNRNPRHQQAELTGFGARACAAHYNSFEALTYFAPAALAVLATQTIGSLHISLAVAFILLRMVYLVAYWFDFDKLRSLVWVGALVDSIVLFCTVF